MPDTFNLGDVNFPRWEIMCADLAQMQRHILSRRPGNRLPAGTLSNMQINGGVALIEINGILFPRAEYYGEVSMTLLAETFRAAAASPDVGAIVLAFDCPGGYCDGMLDLWDAAKEMAAAKPVLSHAAGVLCSGGYWLSCCAQKIYADRRKMVGSIGTRTLYYDWSEAFKQAGIEAVAIDTGPFKSMGALGTKLTDEHRAHLQHEIDQLQTDFAAVVQESRALEGEVYSKIADGRVWLSEEAVALGLLDGVQSLNETMRQAAELAAPSQTRSKKMSTTETPAAPQPATLDELQAALPGASSDFVLGQMKAKATLGAAQTAFIAHQGEQLRTEADAKVAAEKRATDAEAAAKVGKPGATTTPPAKVRGNKPTPSASGGTEGGESGDVNYVEMAKQLAAEKKISYRDACMQIKKQHPEARDAFKGAVLQG
jgi:signal peptide peptidase SppA